MSVFKSIVVGTDGSRAASEAVAKAADIARALEATLHIVCAYQPIVAKGTVLIAQNEDQSRGTALEILEDARQAIGGEHQAEVHAVMGDAADALVDAAERQGAGLIVLGSRGMRGARRYLLGSIPNKVSHHATCDVLIVRTK